MTSSPTERKHKMGRFTLAGKNTSVNSLWSIWYCILVLGLQAYITYVAIAHYRHSTSLQWGTSKKTPSELTSHVGLICLSLLCVPVFIIASLFRIGNYANDGVKFGRDHVMRFNNLDIVSNPARCGWFRTVWRHFCPVSQTVHLIMAFCSLLPTTMTVAMEIKYGYQSTGLYFHFMESDCRWYRWLLSLHVRGKFNICACNGKLNCMFPAGWLNVNCKTALDGLGNMQLCWIQTSCRNVFASVAQLIVLSRIEW